MNKRFLPVLTYKWNIWWRNNKSLLVASCQNKNHLALCIVCRNGCHCCRYSGICRYSVHLCTICSRVLWIYNHIISCEIDNIICLSCLISALIGKYKLHIISSFLHRKCKAEAVSLIQRACRNLITIYISCNFAVWKNYPFKHCFTGKYSVIGLLCNYYFCSLILIYILAVTFCRRNRPYMLRWVAFIIIWVGNNIVVIRHIEFYIIIRVLQCGNIFKKCCPIISLIIGISVDLIVLCILHRIPLNGYAALCRLCRNLRLWKRCNKTYLIRYHAFISLPNNTKLSAYLKPIASCFGNRIYVCLIRSLRCFRPAASCVPRDKHHISSVTVRFDTAVPRNNNILSWLGCLCLNLCNNRNGSYCFVAVILVIKKLSVAVIVLHICDRDWSIGNDKAKGYRWILSVILK